MRVITLHMVARFLAAGLPLCASAQGTARSQDIDTSIRAAGMGGAGAAVGWGEPGIWGNPATLGEVRGLWWQEGRTQLVPGLATDVIFKSRRFVLGGAGIGVSLMGDPFDGLGRTRLDYGTSEGTDPFGNPTGTFISFEQIEGWGVGISPLRLVDTWRALRGHAGPAWSRFGDASVGVQRKHTKVALAPASAFGFAEADCVDWGVRGRISPQALLTPEAPVELDVSAGYAVLNSNDAQFVFLPDDVSSPPSRIRRLGFAVRAAMPSPWRAQRPTAPRAWWRAGPEHLFELGIASDTERISAGGTDPSFQVERFGVELALLDVLVARKGHVTDRLGDINGDTQGYGIHVPVGPWGGFRYDHATVPQAAGSGLPDVQRHGWSVWLDPVEIWRDAQPPR